MTDRPKTLDPKRIDMVPRHTTVAEVVDRMRHGTIDLRRTDGTRTREPWDVVSQSRLIESFLIRVPTPTLYFDTTDNHRWVVIDGLRRLLSIYRFVVTESLELEGLEYLDRLEGKTYGDLSNPDRRRLLMTPLDAYAIRGDTPPDVRDNIARRLTH
jgi:hypothetical protein